ncbi:MAG TPA: CRISPR-associated endonuclease Cas1 [Chloroflexi bacterium]|nr:CRISPR-associated endonuclease Cas1 [Chloroflexota bacterium]
MPVIQHLIADQFGSHIGKHSKRLRVTAQGEKLLEAPLLHLEAVLITSRGVSISADALQACAEEGIPVFFLDSLGRPYASLYAAGLTGTVQTRRAQLLAYHNELGCAVAVAFARGKIHNQTTTLKYFAKNRKESDPELYEELRLSAGEVNDHQAWLDAIPLTSVDEARQAILTAEAHAARRYWNAVGWLVPPEYEWPGRQTRGALDPINSALNYGYGILYGQIERAVVLAGLDPYAGFIHADRPGKPSLVLDLIEEFRQVAVDRVIVGLATRQTNIEQDGRGRLTKETRRMLAEHVLNRLETPLRYEKKRVPLRHIIQSQARHLATFLRGEREAYEPFRAGW